MPFALRAMVANGNDHVQIAPGDLVVEQSECFAYWICEWTLGFVPHPNLRKHLRLFAFICVFFLTIQKDTKDLQAADAITL
jgi:hypothetical protein